MASQYHSGSGDNVLGDKIIKNYFDLSAIGIISLVITVGSLIISLPILNILIPIVEDTNRYIKGLLPPLKLILFFVSELANAYFFGSIISRILKNVEEKKLEEIKGWFLVLFCVAMSAFVSMLFLVTTIFNKDSGNWYEIFILAMYVLSFIITFIGIYGQLTKVSGFSDFPYPITLFVIGFFYVSFYVYSITLTQ